MFCSKCGNGIADGSRFCPKCGQPVNVYNNGTQAQNNNVIYTATQNVPVTQSAQYNIMSIVGLVISCISLLLNFWGLVGIAGTIVSVVGLVSCKRKHEKGQVCAIIGIIIGVFSIVYGAIALINLASTL